MRGALPAVPSGRNPARRAERIERALDGHLEGSERVLEARLIVRRGHEPWFARIRLAQDALIVQHARHGVVEGVVAALPVAVGARRIVGKVQAAHGWVSDETVRDATGLEDSALAAAQA